MKNRSLFLVLIFAVLTFTSRAQITEMYHQGFETNEGVTYNTTGAATVQTSIYSGGSRAIKMQHSTSGNTVIELDTIDLSSNSDFSHFTLEFMHICDVSPTACTSNPLVALIDIKYAGTSTWTPLSQSYYNTEEGGSSQFPWTSAFSNVSYNEWGDGLANNTKWKHERFDLDDYFRGVSVVDRKLQIRMTLKVNDNGGNTNAGWYIDDIVVKASPQAIIKPRISMVSFPDFAYFPSSRGAEVSADITTTVSQGMSADSVYVEYLVGSSPVHHKLVMHPVAGHTGRYSCRIPFEGYDTVMTWRLVARDATTNHNKATFPSNESAWQQYRCVRGADNSGSMAAAAELSNGGSYPFPSYGDNRSEFVYDSATLAAAGYKAGAITSLSFIINSAPQAQTRERFQIKMRNVATDYATSANNSFTSDFMKVVYDDAFVIEASTPGTVRTVNLQDTFFYAGRDIVMQITYDNASTNPQSAQIKLFPAPATKKSIYIDGYNANMGFDPFLQADFFSTATNSEAKRPYFVFDAHKNMPLVHDCGIASLTYPNYYNAATAGRNDSVAVWLKNYGSAPAHGVRIAYAIDNGSPVHYNWTGTLAAGDSTRVVLSTTQRYEVGYHTIKAWVGDSVKVSGTNYIDHEPYNDTASDEFITCSGAMNGTRQVGGTNADFPTLESFLFSLQRCGVDGPLTVKLAPGAYNGVVFPSVPGGSSVNYVQFEPLSDSVYFLANTAGTTLVDLQDADHIRFKNIGFRHPQNAPTVNYLVSLSQSSSDCHFENCWFEDLATRRVTSLVLSGGADSLVIDRCRFVGGTIGVDITGHATDMRAKDNKILRSDFSRQYTNAIKAVNQTSVVIDSNYMNDVLSNSSYILLSQHCYGGTRITANKIFTSHGASCIGVANMMGSSLLNCVVANNMLVCEDDGTANQISTPMNIISAQYAKVVYNSVKMIASQRTNIAAATLGGGAISNVQFQNNIITCFDDNNYAFSYSPGTGRSIVVGHNVYYSQSGLMNKYSGTACNTLAEWMRQVPADNASRNVNPSFLNGSRVDLRSYNQQVKGCATPIPEVTTDMFGNARDASAPCAGAFEFVALFYDFNIDALSSPEAVYCAAPDSIPLNVVIRNAGVNVFTPGTSGTLQLSYQCGNQTGSVDVTAVVPAGDTVTFYSGKKLRLAPDGKNDATYQIRLWFTSTIDPNPVNDTADFSVISRYHPGAPTPINIGVGYGASTTINVTDGIDQWPIDVYGFGRQRPSTVCWYADSLDTEPFFRGNSYTTPLMYDDTSYYIAQSRDMGMMRITEVQISRNGVGVTSPYPVWFGSAVKLAVELTNVGDYPVNLQGDTLKLLNATSTSGTKTWVLPNVTVAPEQSIVLQFGTGNTTDSSATLFFGSSVSPTASNDFAIIYRDGYGVADVVAFNNVTTKTQWTSESVSNIKWQGSGITLNTSVAGVVRTGWPNATATTPSASTQQWSLSSNNCRMSLGTPDPSLVVYRDNGCEGDRSKVTVTLTSRPTTDISLEDPVVSEGCGLGMEPISVVIHNYGSQTCNEIVMHYASGSSTCTETVSSPLAPGASMNYTFSQLLDMNVDYDSEFTIKVWADSCSGDFVRRNDTSLVTVPARYTPEIPGVASEQEGIYGTSITLASATAIPDRASFVWYDNNMVALDTADTYTTPLLYNNDTMYVSSVAKNNEYHQFGSLTTMTNPTSATTPSPYSTIKKNAKEQYIYTAAELLAQGVRPGPISAVAFYLDTLMGTVPSVTFSSYSISLGTTTNSTFASNSAPWVATTTYFSSDDFTISKSHQGWVEHVFDEPFIWDGTSNIVVQVCRSLTQAVSTGVKTAFAAATNKVMYKFDDNAAVCGTTASGTRSNSRPDIRFGNYIFGCTSEAKEIHLNISGVPEYEAALLWPEGSDTVSYSSCGNMDIDVVLSNRGSNSLTDYNLQYSIDGAALTTVPASSTIGVGENVNITVASPSLMPGLHTMKVIVNAVGDQFPVNDTVFRAINVKFCTGTYTIGTNGDYPNFSSAIDSLHNAGVDGPIVFSVSDGVYREQLDLHEVVGSSDVNTITFQSASADSSAVVLVGQPTAAANYVLQLDNGASNINFKNMSFRSAGTTTNNHVLVLANAHDIRFDHSRFCVKAGVDNQNASCVRIAAGGHDFAFSNCVFDSGYVSLSSPNTVAGAVTGVSVDSCQLVHFTSRGIDFANVDNVHLHSNYINTGVTINNRALTGISIDADMGALSIQKNQIIIKDQKTATKVGININNSQGTVTNRDVVYNNMISCSGTGNGGNNSYGISIDGTSKYINVYFNTVRMTFTPTSNTNTAAFKTGAVVSNVYVLNNIFSNFGRGYSYYATANASILTSDYNDYYSTGVNGKFAFWAAEMANIDALRTASGSDANSLNVQPYFVSDEDLHLTISNLSTHAQYNGEVIDDIDGTTRPQIPAPTIGAHEYPIASHNVTIAEIIKPELNPNDNVESDPILVKVKIFNNGGASERNITWYAELDGVAGTRSVTRTINALAIGQMITDSVMVNPPLGVVDTQTVKVYLNLATDVEPEDNIAEAKVFLSPAFNLRASSVSIPTGCKLYNAQVTMSIKNEGKKPILGTEPITIGYEIQLQTSGITVPNLPIRHEETITLGTDLPVNIARDITFNQTANIYPVGIDQDITVKPRGWVSYQYDLKPANDTIGGSNKKSYYTPHAPEGVDLHIPYATSDTIWASQINSRPVRWHRDSTQAPFYAPTNYERSTHWDNTPQYFHDSIYYLSCISGQCTSDFSQVHVYLNPRVSTDASVVEIVQPINNRVYVENDTVKISITNYGTSPLSNIPLVYQVLYGSGNNRTELQRVTEVYPGPLQPDEVYVYTFDSLMQIPEANINLAKSYTIRAWTDLNNEMIRINDTARNNYEFRTLALSSYCQPSIESTAGLDITRVSFNDIDWDMPEVGRGYNDFGAYASPEVPVLHLARGTVDSLIFECANNENPEDHRSLGRVGVFFDLDRNGQFVTSNNPATNELLATGVVTSRTPAGFLVNIPQSASFGYMKMRVVLLQDTLGEMSPCNGIAHGAVQDYLVYIDETPKAVDAAATRIATLRKHIIDTSDHVVSFTLANRGSTALSSVSIHYSYNNLNTGHVLDSTFQWTGNLVPFTSTNVALPSFDFEEGTTELTITVEANGDEVESNNVLRYEYHVFHVITLSMEDNFDSDIDMWYAPKGYNDYSYNQWQRGVPSKTRINAAYSEPNVWATGLTAPVVTGKMGSLSMLYSPIIDISTIRSDTLSFMLTKNILEGSYLTMEYFNYAGHWVKLDASSVIDWYDDENGFSGNSNGYVNYKFSTSVVSGEFPERLQFRFVYYAAPGSQATTNYGEGCAIDNFSIKRGRRAMDVGVLAITHPTQPQFGQTISPTVTIINYGLDTVRSVAVAYRPYGSYMPREETYTGVIAPNGGTASFTFSESSAFVVTNNYPDTFQMCAFTRSSSDLYHDNDTACGEFHLYPLDNDMAMESFISPNSRIVAGDSILVTVRLRNFGQAGISSSRVTAVFNGSDPVTEEIDFQSILGRELGSMEFFNYTFHHKFRASMGTMSLTAYSQYDYDDYIYNDTITMRLNGISAITDLMAREIIVDTSNQQYVRVQLVIDNVGARAANNFEVGFFYDNDTSTIFRQMYVRDSPIASLSMGAIVFDTLLPTRAAPYDHVCAFVHVDGDNDPTNDTTTSIARQYVDIHVIKLLVEENRYDTCHVRMQVENIGNLSLTRTQRLTATINGTTISTTSNRIIEPGVIYHLDFDMTIPKSSSRTYAGTGKLSSSADVDQSNNQTSLIEVQNYFEGVPTVEDSEGYELSQNYPNPFRDQTTVEFKIPEGGTVRLFVTDLVGRMVYEQVQRYEAGIHQVSLSSDEFRSGVYFYGIECGDHRLMRKMVVK